MFLGGFKNVNLQYFLVILLLMFTDGFIATQVSTSKEIIEKWDPQVTFIANTIYFSLIGLAILFFILKKTKFLKILLITIAIFMTFVLIDDVRALMFKLPLEKEGAVILIDAFFIWVFNIFLFTAWYWTLDRGGIEKRSIKAKENLKMDLIFPQEENRLPGWKNWQPGFLDYMFFSFYSCMSWSPTDILVLSKRMKFLLMIQSSISLIILAMIAARAINIIG